MAESVARSIRDQRHLIIQAGTGTGKSLAYLVPALVLGTRAVVSTATKALQDQLATRDLPHLSSSLGVPFEFAILKGRSNYICQQRVAEVVSGDQQLGLDGEDGATGPSPMGLGFSGADSGGAPLSAGHPASATVPAVRTVPSPLGSLGPLGREIRRLVEWAAHSPTGERAELSWEPSPAAWSQLSVGARECPGAGRCPSGSICFAEAARHRAAQADVVVVNTHLYMAALAAGGEVLPPHDLVVFDEAHEVEDIASSAFGFEIGAGRFQALARSTRPLLADSGPAAAVDEAGALLGDALRPHHGAVLPRPLDAATAERVTVARDRVQRLAAAIRRAVRGGDSRAQTGPQDGLAGNNGPDAGLRARHLRAQQAAGHLLGDLNQVLELTPSEVAWVEGSEHTPVLRVAPLDVGDTFQQRLWSREDAPTAVLTSATIPLRLGERLGLTAGTYDTLDVGTPFAYDEQALLYCPVHLPEPRHPGYEAALHDELVGLIEAAEGRTLALFTSWRAMTAAADAVRQRVAWPVLTQSDMPKPALLSRFSADEHTCLFATMGFWQGVDIPGPALSVVAIDRLPFPRPDDPLLQARRASLGRGAFGLIDLPRAATLLAQGTGRLIRSRSDRGVVAVLDSRLGTARYRWELINALPPMRRTRWRSDVEAFLAQLREGSGPAGSPASPAAP